MNYVTRKGSVHDLSASQIAVANKLSDSIHNAKENTMQMTHTNQTWPFKTEVRVNYEHGDATYTRRQIREAIKSALRNNTYDEETLQEELDIRGIDATLITIEER